MNYIVLFLLQFDWNKLRPENLFGQQVLERTPAGLSLIYMGGVALLLFLLILSFVRNLRPKFAFEDGLPREVKRKLSRTQTNRSLRIWQFIFISLTLTIFGFHVYWTAFAEKDNERFQILSNRDLRVRRTASTSLRGWMFDRTGKLASSLAYYKKDKDGDIIRAYSLDREMAHLMGTELSTPGLDRTLYSPKVEPMPEAWEVLTWIKKPEDLQTDVKITIDRDLQAYLGEQLKGKKGAVVVLNPQNGEILAMYSNPSFALSEADSADELHKLERDKMNKPLLSRVMREYYVPGSTFKTFTMISAFRANKQESILTSSPEGFIAFRGSRPILDANGGCEPPYGCIPLNIAQAYEASSNQYFAQMAVTLGKERIRETAGILGMKAVETPKEAVQAGFYPDILNTSNKRIANALAPQQSTIVTGKDITAYDVGLEGMGQGYAGQMTPFQMALVVSAAANLEGKLMKPKIELDQPPQMYSQVLSPEQAYVIRQIMALVTEGAGGTAPRVFANVRAQGIRVGGKTGTAEKQAPVYDANGKLKTVKKKRKDRTGKIIEYDAPVMYERTDSWFVCLAPLEKPTLAIAVVVEGGGFGAKTAAPIAANVILKARELGLLGEQYKPKTQTPTPAPTKKRRNG
jgi:penicillin-binding protein A